MEGVEHRREACVVIFLLPFRPTYPRFLATVNQMGVPSISTLRLYTFNFHPNKTLRAKGEKQHLGGIRNMDTAPTGAASRTVWFQFWDSQSAYLYRGV